ncbi:hypothetical protein QBC37DRAFT_202670 [Rhypophila decipiens]|uniref:Uncharacterized protein n=1 Tax=Rhypophila decipiens TaxID=261697 RepID=A0AAN6Y4I4_9PEZI|nr:hypothetical protein QBC37DRAFT_202670 [Rhypophila decipiens]
MARVIAVETRYGFGFLALLYLTFLFVPWILTCAQARIPFLLTAAFTRASFKYDIEAHGIQQADADRATGFTYVLDALSYLAAVVALPVLYEVLARAAVIYTLRTRKSKTLNAAQVFALADRKFLSGFLHHRSRNRFFAFSGLLILCTVAYHILRGAVISTTWNRYPLVQLRPYSTTELSTHTPNSWDVEEIGVSPAPNDIQALPSLNVMTKLRQAIIATHPDEWQRDAWWAEEPRYRYGYENEKARFFATSLNKNTTTGLVRNLALRMDSEFEWTQLSGGPDEPQGYPENCPGGEEFPFRHPRLVLNVCIQGNGTGIRDGEYVSPWTNTTENQVITEQIYVQMPRHQINGTSGYRDRDQSEVWNWKGDFKYTVTTRLGFFVLGNDKNNHTFSPRLDRLNESDTQIIALAREHASRSFHNDRKGYIWMQEDQRPVPGPLTLAARAMFGQGSFYDISQRIYADAADRSTWSDMLSGSCPFPFQRHPKLNYDCSEGKVQSYVSEYWAAGGVVTLLKSLVPDPSYTASYPSRGPVRAGEVLDSALYLANKAVMDLAIVEIDGFDTQRPDRLGIFHTEGVAVRQFDVSDRSMASMSALLGLQVLGILALLCYTYRLPAWTSTLDALAVARITHQLKDGNLLLTMGLRKPTESEIKKLREIDALIGVVEPIPVSDMSSTAAATTRASGSGDHGTGRSSSTHGHAQSHHSQAPVVSVESNDHQMGMGTIPIDVQTVISEDLDNNDNNTNINNNDERRRNSRNLDVPQHPTAVEGSSPRLSLSIADMVPEHDNEDSHPGGPSSPPAYTPRTGQPELNLMPPSYASALAVNGLRVGAPGLVTRKNIPRTMDDVWV